jgi:hypothetical protein
MIKFISAFVLALAAVISMSNCGADDKDKKTSTASTFDTTINPIVKDSCGTSACHGSGASQTVYVDNEVNFKADGDEIIEQLESDLMPQSPQSDDWTAANEKVLVDYLNAL